MSEMYLVCWTDATRFVDKKTDQWPCFNNDRWNDFDPKYRGATEDFVVSGDLGDPFFSSIEEAKEFCIAGVKRDIFLKNMQDLRSWEEPFVNFTICKVSGIGKGHITRKGKVIEYTYLADFEDEVEDFSVDVLADFEHRLREDILQSTLGQDISEYDYDSSFEFGQDIRLTQYISNWIVQNSDLVLRHIGSVRNRT